MPSPPEPVIRLPYTATGTFVGVIKGEAAQDGAGPGSPRGPSVVTRVLPSGRGESERDVTVAQGQVGAPLLASRWEEDCGWPLKAV